MKRRRRRTVRDAAPAPRQGEPVATLGRLFGRGVWRAPYTVDGLPTLLVIDGEGDLVQTAPVLAPERCITNADSVSQDHVTLVGRDLEGVLRVKVELARDDASEWWVKVMRGWLARDYGATPLESDELWALLDRRDPPPASAVDDEPSRAARPSLTLEGGGPR
ncbi:MAG: hypothetical protein M3Z05_15450 [Gemmatimonadota bacterium]|nr:hypothetical protein [Gemmatimonadota bacterium]